MDATWLVSTTCTYLSWLRHDNYVDAIADTIHVASMDEIDVTYVDDDHADNHDHDDYFYWLRLQRYKKYEN